MKLRKWELALVLALALTLLFGAGAAREQRALAGKLIRLHVVANSDAPEDQALKLAVRDRVLSELTPALAGAPSRDDALAAVAASLGALEGAAREVVESQGFAYTVSVSVAREAFPTRDYETFSLPAGEYDALRVELGAAAGRNWWCVVFPPLCVGDSSAAREALSEDEWALITEEDGVPAVKFRVIELWAKLRGWLRR